jgi:hypothetical protein
MAGRMSAGRGSAPGCGVGLRRTLAPRVKGVNDT